jgi:hypothetical protein
MFEFIYFGISDIPFISGNGIVYINLDYHWDGNNSVIEMQRIKNKIEIIRF